MEGEGGIVFVLYLYCISNQSLLTQNIQTSQYQLNYTSSPPGSGALHLKSPVLVGLLHRISLAFNNPILPREVLTKLYPRPTQSVSITLMENHSWRLKLVNKSAVQCNVWKVRRDPTAHSHRAAIAWLWMRNFQLSSDTDWLTEPNLGIVLINFSNSVRIVRRVESHFLSPHHCMLLSAWALIIPIIEIPLLFLQVRTDWENIISCLGWLSWLTQQTCHWV